MPKPSKTPRQRREEAIRQAIANSRIDGFRRSELTEIEKRYIAGEIDEETAVRLLKERAAKDVTTED